MTSIENTLTECGPVVAAARLQGELLSPELLQELDVLRQNRWVAHANRRDYRGDWRVLPLRCLREHVDGHPVLQCFSHHGGNEWEDLPALTQSTALAALLHSLPCRLKSVRLMSLAPGADIKPHRDPGLSWEFGEVRLHLPLCTDSGVDFIVDGQSVPMKLGELWYLNADLEHSVRHQGRSDRVHLVIDCEVSEPLTEWLRAAVRRGEAADHFLKQTVNKPLPKGAKRRHDKRPQ